MRASTASGKEKRKEKRGGNSRVKEGERKGRKVEKGKWKGGKSEGIVGVLFNAKLAARNDCEGRLLREFEAKSCNAVSHRN
jgi:hypothetical protein